MSTTYPAEDGRTGNTEYFPSVYSGWGSWGTGDTGGTGASGGGASGGGGGRGNGNHSSARGGGGGGGAGGDSRAGGGEGGGHRSSDTGYKGQDAYNATQTPIETINENYATFGINSSYGRGGSTNQDGISGFVIVHQISTTPIFDCGPINESVNKIKDCGLTTEHTTHGFNCGNI